MFNVNEYFNGMVKSIGFNDSDSKITIGVMAVGEYEFGTSTIEHMTITSGNMRVLLPEETEWKTYNEYETFIVRKDAKFRVKVDTSTSYKCVYK